MKKLLSILLALALLVTAVSCLAGCESREQPDLAAPIEGVETTDETGAVKKPETEKESQEPLTVLVDLAGALDILAAELDGGYESSEFTNVWNNLLTSVKALTGVEDVELEMMPSQGAERSSRMTRLRTEMMAGQGPDVFIVAHTTEYDPREENTVNSSIFLMPEKSMNLGLFYPLDDFIDKARFMEWDKLNQTVMAAGYNEDYGQVLLPLCYEFPVTLFPKKLVQHSPSRDLTWADMLSDETGVMQAASSFLRGSPFPLYSGTEVFGRLADYKNKSLLFTEEELMQRYKEIMEMDGEEAGKPFAGLPICFKTTANHSLTNILGNTYYGPYLRQPEDYPWNNEWYGGMTYKDFLMQQPFASDPLGADHLDTTGLDTEVTMIPVYSDDGGVTVSVRAFAAINANSKRGEDAFAVLDYLFGEQCMRSGKVYDYITRMGLPVRDDLWEDERSIAGSWSIESANYEELNRIKDCITTVTFADTIAMETQNALWKQFRIESGYEEGDPEKIVHDIYTRMKRELSE